MLNIELNSNWLLEQSEQNGEEKAIESQKVGLSYVQLYEKVIERALLLSNEVNENDIIGIPAEHSYKFIIDLFAIWNLGAIALPLNPKLNQSEIDRQIEFVEGKIISNLNETRTESQSTRKYDPDKISLIMFTSGSTGERKAVQHTFSSLYANAKSIDAAIPFQQKEKWLASLPLYRIGGFQIIIRSMLSGGILCMPNSVQSDEILESISIYEPNYLSLVNASLKNLLENNVKGLQNSKAIFVGGGPVDSNLLKEGIKKVFPLYKVYGSTETGSMISILSPEDTEAKIESAGKPMDKVTLRISDEEICVQSDSLFRGYYKNSKLTDKKIKDGFYFTGDIGYFDVDGFLYIKKRKDNFIISGGEKIDPKEIENELNSFENITESYVLGIPDEKWGRKVCAVIVGNSIPDISEIKERLKQKLPSYKIPKEVKQVEHFPIDEMGKINRDELLKLFR